MSAAAPIGGSVDDWLDWQLALHDTEIELGLDRVAAVARTLEVLPPPGRSVVVAGTNGKGSCVALIESLLSHHGRVGSYTSPHLWRYNERIRIDGAPVADTDLCAAFAAVEAARGGVALTFFEFGTLAALWLFARAALDFLVLEVGLGGRLDAVNVVDGDVALVTNIGLDHVAWLGDDREQIGFEKAGIFRAGRPAVCADRDMPASIAERAATQGTPLAVIGRDFDLQAQDDRWCWRDGDAALDIPAQAGVLVENLAAALSVVRRLGAAVRGEHVIAAARVQAALPGRRERVVDGDVAIIYDVGHNAEAIAVLVDDLARQPVPGRTHVVLGMLADKPVEAAGGRLRDLADALYIAGLDTVTDRGLPAAALAKRLASDAPCHPDPATALAAARAVGAAGDRIVVCGSFFTVANARRQTLSCRT